MSCVYCCDTGFHVDEFTGGESYCTCGAGKTLQQVEWTAIAGKHVTSPSPAPISSTVKSPMSPMNTKTEFNWQVGDLCKAVYDNIGEGIIYRVTAVNENRWSKLDLDLVPVFGVLANIKGRRKRSLDTAYCTPLSLVDMGTEYMLFGNFIKEEAKLRGA